jgi:hypothetical protein
MAAEKNLPWGRKLSAPVGLGLLGWSAVILLNGLFSSKLTRQWHYEKFRSAWIPAKNMRE